MDSDENPLAGGAPPTGGGQNPHKILHSILKYSFLGLVGSTLAVSVFGGAVFLYFSRGLPDLFSLSDYKPKIVTTIHGKDGIVIGEHFEERRYVLPPDQIPDLAVKAFVAAEDDRFFEHQGIDFHGIVRAAIANFKAGKVVQGGSTITQQVAKSLLLTPERSFGRKFKELILANRMERNFNKKQIIYLYLNQIYLGQGSYGIEAAARTYFSKSAKDLSLAEVSILAGLPQAPSKYSPLQNPKAAKQRQLYVLRRMAETGFVSSSQAEAAGKEPLRIHFPRDHNLKFAPYYVEYVRKYLLEKYGKENLYAQGLDVSTPVDARLATVAMNALQEGVRAADRRQGYRGPIQKIRAKKEEAEALDGIAKFNLEKKFPFAVLGEDGGLSAGFQSYAGLYANPGDILAPGQLYKALVFNVDDARKEVLVDLGFIKGVIPYEHLRWAQPERNAVKSGVEPISRPSQALARGDVVWVALVGATSKEHPDMATLSLEQIPAVQGALLSMDTRTGEVISMVGGYDFAESEFNRAVQAERQMGSAYKPVIYSAAIDKGYTPATVIQDSPIVFDAGENEKWKPDNYEERFYGDTLFRSALIHSRNIPTIKIVQDIEVPYLVDYSTRLGLPDKFNRDLSISLGSATASLLDLAAVYAIFPRGGHKMKPIFILSVKDREGNVLEEHKPEPFTPRLAGTAAMPRFVQVAGELQTQKAAGALDANFGKWQPNPNDPDQVMDARTAYVMTHLMTEVTTYGTGHEVKNLGRPAAGKTGTTNDFLDAWFMGFTPQVVTGVWVGFDAQKSLGSHSAGASTALPIWMNYMKEGVKNTPEEDFAVPQGVIFSFINVKTGKLAPANAPGVVREAFIEGTQPGAGGGSRGAAVVGGAASPGGARVPAPRRDSDQQDFFKEDIE